MILDRTHDWYPINQDQIKSIKEKNNLSIIIFIYKNQFQKAI